MSYMIVSSNAVRFFSTMAISLVAFSLAAAKAQTPTSTLGVQITIQAGCVVQNVVDINFGTVGLLNSNVDAQGSFDVVCTTGVPYSLSLNGGGGGAITDRRMISGASTINYQLYRDTARTLVWGDTVNVDRVVGVGSGAVQVVPVYGRVPPQNTPAVGTYNDSVTITINY